MGRNLNFSKNYSLFRVLWRKFPLLRQSCVKHHARNAQLLRYFSDSNQSDEKVSEESDLLTTHVSKDKHYDAFNERNHSTEKSGEFSQNNSPVLSKTPQPMHKDGSVQRITKPMSEWSHHQKTTRRRLSRTDSVQSPVSRSEKLDDIQLRLQKLSSDQILPGLGKREKMNKTLGEADQILPGLGKREKMNKTLGEAEEIDPQPIPIIVGEMLFGLHPVSLAIRHGRRKILSLYVKEETRGDNSVNKGDNYRQVEEIIELAKTRNIPVKTLTRSQLDKCSNNRPHQGICLDVSPIKSCVYRSEEVQKLHISRNSTCNRLPLWLLLYQIQDPMNFGAILRSAYMLGVNRVIRTSINSCSLTPVVSKASAGAMEIMDIYSITEDLSHFIKSHQEAGWSVLGTASANSNISGPLKEDCTNGEDNREPECSYFKPIPIHDYSMDNPVILIIGNEGLGLPQSVLRCCDQVVCAEVAPDTSFHLSVDSLNVSVATGILLHSLMLRRKR